MEGRRNLSHSLCDILLDRRSRNPSPNPERERAKTRAARLDRILEEDHLEQSEEKVTMTQNVQQSATSHSTETLKSAEDEPALKPLNFERPKRKLLPASAIHFKDFNGLLMEENVMDFQEAKQKKPGDVKARSDGSISLIRILKSNLPR